MSESNITEVLRNLESQFKQRQTLLQYYRGNENSKAEVEKIIKNNQWSLKVQDSPSGNIWANCENLRQNIEKMDKEISIYEGLKRSQNKFR